MLVNNPKGSSPSLFMGAASVGAACVCGCALACWPCWLLLVILIFWSDDRLTSCDVTGVCVAGSLWPHLGFRWLLANSGTCGVLGEEGLSWPFKVGA